MTNLMANLFMNLLLFLLWTFSFSADFL